MGAPSAAWGRKAWKQLSLIATCFQDSSRLGLAPSNFWKKEEMSDCEQLAKLTASLETLQNTVRDLQQNLGTTFLAKVVEHVKDGVAAEIKKSLSSILVLKDIGLLSR
ncbi:hypothetical protein EBZ37_13980 [bacterium]|nr:hypothetical protein [bacterium]